MCGLVYTWVHYKKLFIFYFPRLSNKSENLDLYFSQVKHHLVTPTNESIQVSRFVFSLRTQLKDTVGFDKVCSMSLEKSRNSPPEGETHVIPGRMTVL